MGVDVTAKVVYGTQKDIRKKLPKIITEFYDDQGGEAVYDGIEEDYETKKQKETIKDFVGFALWENSYDETFEGFGIEIEDFSKLSDYKEKAEKLFDKYKLGNSEVCKFEHWW
jgi:ABC-type Fe3+-hydroxamate transport system substrate-binding protein